MKSLSRAPWLGALALSLSLVACGEAPTPPSSPPSHAQASLREPARRFVPGHVIVKFRESAEASLRDSPPTLRGFRAQDDKALAGGARLWSLEPEQRRLGASIAEEEADLLGAIEALRADPRVEYAHEDLYMEYFAVPSDPLYAQQWHYPAINLPTAWNSVTGSVKVAVLDTGRLSHPDLNGKWTAGYDFGDNDADPTDDDTYHHGLHVAGIVAANANNGIGGAGVCWGCQLMPVKVSNNNAPVLSNVGNAIRWAADNGARVINMSFGTTSGTAPCSGYAYIQSAVTYAVQKNVVVVAAAGNNTADTANVTPASCTGVIAVAASGRDGQLAPYSNRGERVDVTAPGGGPAFYGDGIGCPVDGTTYSGTDGAVSTWAAYKAGTTLLPGDYCYRYLSGTSMASPHVAGLAALILSQRPSMTPAQVTARIKGTATPLPCKACGTGLINAAAAIYPPLPTKPAKGNWYNPARNGNGLDIQYAATDSLSLTWLTYTSAGAPIWYMSTLTAETGVWAGDLYESYWNGSSASATKVGTAKLTLSAGQWRYVWTKGAASGNEPIQPLAFGGGFTTMNLSGNWYNAQESGWGILFDSRGTVHVANVLIYNGTRPTWVQGVVDSGSTSLSFSLSYVTGTNLCPGCTGTPSTAVQPAGTFTVSGSAGVPSTATASTQVSFPGGTWYRSPFTLSRLTGP
ncbi:S8 family serine peptidase [Pyxidicoccus caerfyrddinensis]|uniref:S8 family serine peptidase n=1 Tax=Pyxidicoccus caerfyrddinensis TaxID=2709663 RepID=UPI0013D9C75A|nr:S8 family serine peptidase [Pyxidicoccus caerfyrddinensis]